ncbi:MAG: alpha/beta fold hydrolase [Chloroflexota bacterium]
MTRSTSTPPPKGWSRKYIDAEITSTLTARVDDLKAQGVDLSAYNSNENVADIVDVAKALGYDKIDYYGQSYGTLLGQYLLAQPPRDLDAVILDGIVDADKTRHDQLVSMPDSLQRMYDACAQGDPQGPVRRPGADRQGHRQEAGQGAVSLTVKDADGTDQTIKIGSTPALNFSSSRCTAVA